MFPDADQSVTPLAATGSLTYGLVALAMLGLAGLIWLAFRLLPGLLSAGHSALQGVTALPPVQRRLSRHPRLAGGIARRLDAGRFTGLPATVLAVVFLYLLSVWVGSVLDWLAAAPVVALDTRVAQLMHTFWSPGLLRATAYVAGLGDTRLVGAVTLAVVVWLVVQGRRDLALGMAVAVVGNGVSVTVLKLVFQRDRPAFAYFIETTSSFPSGHAAISVAFWGMLLYVAWRAGWLRLGTVLVLAPLFALVIGASRVFLAQHYLSDVINGWLVGTLWLLAAVAISEWWYETQGRHPGYGGAARGLAVALGLAAAVLSVWIVAFHDKARSEPWTGPEAVIVQAPADLPALPGFDTQAESIIGTPLAPVNVILLAQDNTAVARALPAAGWAPATRPDLAAVLRAAFDAWRRTDDPTAPLAPWFWGGMPPAMVFESEGARLRLWASPWRLPGGARIYAGAVSAADQPDRARAQLTRALTAAGAGVGDPVIIGEARQGQAGTGAVWSTDGQAAVLSLR